MSWCDPCRGAPSRPQESPTKEADSPGEGSSGTLSSTQFWKRVAVPPCQAFGDTFMAAHGPSRTPLSACSARPGPFARAADSNSTHARLVTCNTCACLNALCVCASILAAEVLVPAKYSSRSARGRHAAANSEMSIAEVSRRARERAKGADTRQRPDRPGQARRISSRSPGRGWLPPRRAPHRRPRPGAPAAR